MRARRQNKKQWWLWGLLLIIVLAGIIGVVSSGMLESAKQKIAETTGRETEEEGVPVKLPFVERTVKATYINVLSKGLNIREKPDDEGRILDRVPQETKFQVLSVELDSHKRKWYEVEYQPGKRGFAAGWFTAETEITILVKEHETVVQAISVKPVPIYLENPFNPEKAKLNSEFNGLVLSEKKENQGEKTLVFQGQVELNGSYQLDSQRSIIHFQPDEASSVLLPRVGKSLTSVAFEVKADEKTINQLATKGNEGQTSLVIDRYIIQYGRQKSINQANLVQIK